MTRSSADLLLVHGFLGQPSDMHKLEQSCHNFFKGRHTSVNLWNLAAALPSCTLESLAERLVPEISENTIAIGYSLGGRLLMHLPESVLKKLKGVVLISSHFGLNTSHEKAERLEMDHVWAQRFRKEEWSSLMASWEEQAVFQQDHHRIARAENKYTRDLLAQVLVGCSLGTQNNQIENGALPFEKMLYVHGAQDTKYTKLANKWKTEQPQIAIESVPGGHFPLVNSAEAIAERISTFYINLMKSSQVDQ